MGAGPSRVNHLQEGTTIDASSRRHHLRPRFPQHRGQKSLPYEDRSWTVLCRPLLVG